MKPALEVPSSASAGRKPAGSRSAPLAWGMGQPASFLALIALAACYALANLHPTLYSQLSVLIPVVGCLLPLSWAYAFWRVPSDTRLTPGRLAMAAVPR